MFFSVIQILAANVGDSAATSVLERLDPPKRAAVVMALLGLVLTGLVLVTCVMLGAHWVRGLARHRPGGKKPRAISPGPAANRRLRDTLDSMLPSAKSSDTVQLDSSTSDTVVDPGDR